MKARFTRFDKALKAATEKSIAASQAEIERQLAEALKPPEQPSDEEMKRPRFFPSRIGRRE